MAIPQTAYYYNAQIRRYILQFMAIFAGLQVQVGKRKTGNTVTTSTDNCDGTSTTTASPEVTDERLISVPVHYGHMDRIVAAIVADNTQTKPIRLPTMSAYMTGINIAQERMKGIGTERRQAYVPVGGLIPDDIKVVHQRMAVPYDMKMELAIWASNTDQHFQILEQIFMLFDPQLNIQASDAPFDWTRLTHVKLEDVAMESNYSIGTDRRIIQSALTFDVPIWIDSPAEVRRDFVEKIYARIGAVSNAALTNYDIIAELDQQGIEYQLLLSADDLGFQ